MRWNSCKRLTVGLVALTVLISVPSIALGGAYYPSIDVFDGGGGGGLAPLWVWVLVLVMWLFALARGAAGTSAQM